MSTNTSSQDQDSVYARLLSRILDDTGLLFDYLAILKENVYNASTESESKFLEIIKNLEKIKDESGFLLDEIKKQKDKALIVAEQKRENLKNNKSILEDMKNYQKLRDEEIINRTKIIKKTMVKMTSLIELANTITDINEQTHLLAINSAVLAAKAGIHGRAFSVVSKELQKLSEKIKITSTELEHQIKTFNIHIDEEIEPILNAAYENREKEFIEKVVSQIDDVSNAFIELGDYYLNITDISFSSIEKIDKRLIDVLCIMQFQDVLRQQLEHTGTGLQDIIEYFSTLQKKITEKDMDNWLDLVKLLKQHESKYVMQKQHKIHDDMMKNDDKEDTTAKVELF